jgi:hypothetical protein
VVFSFQEGVKRIKDADNLFKGQLCYVVKDVADGDVDEIQVG